MAGLRGKIKEGLKETRLRIGRLDRDALENSVKVSAAA